MAKASICTKSVNDDQSGVVFTFIDGEVKTINLSELTPEMVTKAALHGLGQKGVDSYSGVKPEDLDVAKAKLENVLSALRDNRWTVARAGGAVTTDLARAISNVTGRSLAEVIEALVEVDSATKAQFKRLPEVAQELYRMAQEKAEEELKKAREEQANGPGLSAIFGASA
jgi:ribosomal protein L12E/L44/L45/RPP1/RPP2